MGEGPSQASNADPSPLPLAEFGGSCVVGLVQALIRFFVAYWWRELSEPVCEEVRRQGGKDDLQRFWQLVWPSGETRIRRFKYCVMKLIWKANQPEFISNFQHFSYSLNRRKGARSGLGPSWVKKVADHPFTHSTNIYIVMEFGPWARCCVHTPALSGTCYVTVSKFLDFSGPQFPQLKSEIILVLIQREQLGELN